MIQRWLLVALLLGQPATAEQQTAQPADLPGAALFTQGNRHHNGDGVLQNFASAATLFEQAAAQGHAGAQNQLGQYFHSGLGGAQNQKAALRWLRAAADQGDPQHIFDLGKALEQGADGSQDAAAAAEAYQQAAAQGHAEAAVSLGVL